MKTVCNYFYLLCFCLVASRDHVLGETFEKYKVAKEHFEGKGYFNGPYAFARENEEQPDPNEFHDVMGTLFLSEFTYGIGKLRAETKAMSFGESELMDQVGCTESMAKLLTGDKGFRTDPIKMDDVEKVLEYDDYEKSNKRFATELMVTAMKTFKKNNVYIYKFDAKYNNKNLVYSIAGRERSRDEPTSQNSSGRKPEVDLFLTFRGSTTNRDWMQNLQTKLVEIALRRDKKADKFGRHRCYMIEPLTFQRVEITEELYYEFKKIVKETDEPIRIHSGFLGYLFADRGEDELVGPGGLGESMFTNIRRGLLRVLNDPSKENNNLYVTGHSLGGALAHTAAFFLASDAGINNRGANWEGVKCISFAAPSSGNISFQRAFEVLQKKDHYQSTEVTGERSIFTNIRITNSRDPVPMLIPWSRFRQTPGIHTHLGRIFWFRRMYAGNKPSRPTTNRYRAHYKAWQGTWRYPWMHFSPTCFYAGLFGSWGRFLCWSFATAPIVFIALLLLLRPIYILLPRLLPIKGYRLIEDIHLKENGAENAFKCINLKKDTDGKLDPNSLKEVKLDPKNYGLELNWLSKDYDKDRRLTLNPVGVNMEGTLNIVQEFNKWGFGIPGYWEKGFWKFFWRPAWNWSIFGILTGITLIYMGVPNIALKYRFGLVFVVIPSLISYLVSNIHQGFYRWMCDYGSAAFIVVMAIWQVLLFVGRNPWDVKTVKVHSLTNHYEHLRPYHKQLSSSRVLVDKYMKDLK